MIAQLTGLCRVHRSGQVVKSGVLIFILIIIFGLAGCYYQPYSTVSYPEQEMKGAKAAVPSAQVFFYPKLGQSTEQQSRDHYECYNWAVAQTGFDPGQSNIPKEQRLKVVPMPPAGYDTIAMAISGAVLGALFGGPRHAFEGAVIGATGGAIAGAASDTARQQQAQMMEETRNQSRNAQIEEKAGPFRRAMSACLEGRGYSVQ